MHRVLAMHPCPQGKHRQNRKRHQPDSLVAERRPRQNSENNIRCQRQPESIHANPWCTGEDSNLRTSLGGADLQSAGFNHSPTCAETRSLFQGSRKTRPSLAGLRHAQKCCRGSYRKQENRRRTKTTSRANTTLGNASLWSAVGKNRYAAAPRTISTKQRPVKPLSQCWSWRRDLNPRPSDYKSDALPTELRQQ